MRKILFVCLGNICRSPLAEAIFEQKIKEKRLEKKFQSASCGTASYHIGEAPDSRTIAVARKNNIPMAHLGQQLKKQDLKSYDLILAMDKSNFNDILKLASPEDASKVLLFRSFDPEPNDGNVADPWYGNAKDFDLAFEVIDRTCDGLIEALVNQN